MFFQAGYYLDESKGWGITAAELERTIEEAKKVCAPKALVVINPGNPTGQVQSKENIQDIIKFAHKEKLFVFADEVCIIFYFLNLLIQFLYSS